MEHLPELLLTHVLHHHQGADPEDVREAKVDDAVSRTVVSAWRGEDEERRRMRVGEEKRRGGEDRRDPDAHLLAHSPGSSSPQTC